MMSLNPARILGIDKGNLGIGATADITVINLTPHGLLKRLILNQRVRTHRLRVEDAGKVSYTIVGGRVVYKG